MLVDFECSGGFANLRLNYHANTDPLPKEQADEIQNLVENSGFFDLQQRDVATAANGGPPDVFSYRLTLADGTRQKTLTCNDVTAPNSLQPLLATLRKLAIDQKMQRK